MTPDRFDYPKFLGVPFIPDPPPLVVLEAGFFGGNMNEREIVSSIGLFLKSKCMQPRAEVGSLVEIRVAPDIYRLCAEFGPMCPEFTTAMSWLPGFPWVRCPDLAAGELRMLGYKSGSTPRAAKRPASTPPTTFGVLATMTHKSYSRDPVVDLLLEVTGWTSSHFATVTEIHLAPEIYDDLKLGGGEMRLVGARVVCNPCVAHGRVALVGYAGGLPECGEVAAAEKPKPPPDWSQLPRGPFEWGMEILDLPRWAIVGIFRAGYRLVGRLRAAPRCAAWAYIHWRRHRGAVRPLEVVDRAGCPWCERRPVKEPG